MAADWGIQPARDSGHRGVRLTEDEHAAEARTEETVADDAPDTGSGWPQLPELELEICLSPSVLAQPDESPPVGDAAR